MPRALAAILAVMAMVAPPLVAQDAIAVGPIAVDAGALAAVDLRMISRTEIG
jgi:hypothetical protein